MKRILTLILSFLLILGCASCAKGNIGDNGGNEVPPDAVAPDLASPSLNDLGGNDAEKEEEPAPYSDPLTGEPLYEEPSNARPFAVMLNNIKEAQPQCGFSEADIVYEILAEGGVTRMLAIFEDISPVEHIGSIRSLRPYYASVGLAYDAVVVHAGGSYQAYTDVKSYGVNNLDGLENFPANTFYRDSARMSHGSEHSLFATGSLLQEAALKKGYAADHAEGYSYGLSFKEDGTPSGESANKITLNFSSKVTEMSFNGDTGLYAGRQHGGDWYDGNNSEVPGFTNVLMLFAETKVLDNVGRLSVTLTGSGSGYFACGGSYIPITWSRDGLYSAFSYFLEDGTPLALGIGKTYIGVLPTGSKIVFE